MAAASTGTEKSELNLAVCGRNEALLVPVVEKIEAVPASIDGKQSSGNFFSHMLFHTSQQ